MTALFREIFVKFLWTYLMHGGQDVVLFLLRDDSVLFGGGRVVNVFRVEPGFKDAEIVKDLGHQEVEQGPQLGQIVLQRGACSEKKENNTMPNI